MKKFLHIISGHTAAIAAMLLTAAAGMAATPEQYRKSEHQIAMRDGVRLYVSVYAPEYPAGDAPAEKAPILLVRTPYGCGPYGEGMSDFLKNKPYKRYVEEGYIFAFNDVRGRWMSAGDGENIRPLTTQPDGVDDATDAYDLIEWLVDSVPGNNGRVGVYGCSYSGYYALTAAARRHPALRAAVPQAPVCDWFIGDDFHHNGAFAIMPITSFLPQLVTERNHVPTVNQRFIDGLIQGDRRTFFLENKPADILRMADGRADFLDSLYAHPDYDDFWKRRSGVSFTDSLTTPMLVVGGLFDAEDFYGALTTYRALLRNSPALPVTAAYGPWAHGQWGGGGKGNSLGDATFGEADHNEYYRDEIEFPFFEYYLRDKGAAPTADHIFITGANRWYKGSYADLQSDPLAVYLAPGSALSFAAPTDGEAWAEYVSDPNDPVPYYNKPTNGGLAAEYMTSGQQFLDGRHDVLTFSTPALSDTLTLAGPVTPEFYVSISTTDADFVVKVLDEAPDGSETMVRGEIFRGRYRNSFEKPEPFTPGKVEKVRFTMNDIAHAFLPGHKMKVQIQSSWFPLFDMNPQQFINIYKAGKEDYIPSTIKVHFDAAHPSGVTFTRANESR